jgi:signal transduction histidine kinase
VIGVVCHEHCGGPRQWTEKEAEFASAVADMLTILVEQAERAELRAALEAERHAQARAEKMAALQRLARIATHDLNNVLTVAMARSDLIKQGIDPPAMSQEVTQVLSYGAKLVRQLSEFCEERTSSQTVDLRELLRGLEPALRALLGKEVSLQLKIDDTSLLVPIAPVEAEQLILNLCMNASDAITPPGEIRIILSRDSTNDNVLLEIMDSGIGMDEGTQTRIFEPYFSTKSNHSGVGLMAVYGIVQRAGGAIELQSAPGAGTRFRIIIPSSSASAPDQEPPWSFE